MYNVQYNPKRLFFNFPEWSMDPPNQKDNHSSMELARR